MSKTWLGLAMVLAAGHLSGAEPGLPTLAVPDGAGVNIHFTDPRPGEMAMLAQAGFRWVRMDFAWGATEREQGVYDFSAYDRLLAALAPHGIRALFILDYNNPHYDGGLSPCSDEGRRAFANWAVAAVRHFRGQGILWEMYNEPNIGFWKPTPNPDDYVKLALAVGQALRAAEPTAAYIGPATSGIDLPFLVYLGLAAFVVVGTSNATNLTDGLDGLAAGPIAIASAVLLILAYVSGAKLGSLDLSRYLLIPSVVGGQELSIIASAMMGATIGFLFYNSYPAEIFMGDTGSLGLGALLGSMAVLTKNEMLSIIIFGVFVFDALSVIAQTTSFKLTGKRILPMAPVHHSFEKMGWKEPKIVVRFWIASLLLAMVALASIKVR